MSWAGAVVYESVDGGATWQALKTIGAPVVAGQATTILGDGPVTVWDRGNTVTVRLGSEQTLSSMSELAVLNGQNVAMLGAEMLSWRDATLNLDGTYTLGHLLRGQLGTDWATGTHGADERFTVLSRARLRRIPRASATIGATRLYKAVTVGQTLAQAPTVTFQQTGLARKPYSPVHLTGLRDGSSNLTITWIRRARGGVGWIGGSDIPLREEFERYEVDILHATMEVVYRTLLVSDAQTVGYSAADQTTDFGSPQAALRVRVYQLSAMVGRGYPREGVV